MKRLVSQWWAHIVFKKCKLNTFLLQEERTMSLSQSDQNTTKQLGTTCPGVEIPTMGLALQYQSLIKKMFYRLDSRLGWWRPFLICPSFSDVFISLRLTNRIKIVKSSEKKNNVKESRWKGIWGVRRSRVSGDGGGDAVGRTRSREGDLRGEQTFYGCSRWFLLVHFPIS